MSALDADLFTGDLAALIDGALAFRGRTGRACRSTVPLPT